jgi:serine/threonine protein kinase
MSNIVVCERCGKTYERTEQLRGLCPACLFDHALPNGRPASDSEPKFDDSPQVRFVPPQIKELAPHFPQLEILSLIGHGGMSAVYKARHAHLHRTVAVKVLPKEVANRQGGLERFQREAQTLAQLSHPNIVAVYDAGQAGPWCYIEMEYVEGPNLRQLQGGSKLPASDVLRIAAGICVGLQYAHDRGVVHRDIKPENVLLDGEGGIKLVDFGLAKLLNPPPTKEASTKTGQVMGTPHYLAPEQLETPANIDHRADVYSLGVMMYEMLTGDLPLGHFEPPSQRIGSNPALDTVVLRAMSKDPHRRYQRAQDLQVGIASVEASGPETGILKHDLPRKRPVVKELILSLCSVLLALFGCLTLVKASQDYPSRIGDAVTQTAVSLVAFLASFVMARVNAYSATCWRDLSPAQLLCVPVLVAIYALLGCLLLLGPGLAVLLHGGLPLFADPQHWIAFGMAFTESDRASIVSPYWLRIYGVSGLTSACWSILVAFVVHARPGLIRHLFHPLDDETASTITRIAAIFGAAILAPMGCALVYASWIGTQGG